MESIDRIFSAIQTQDSSDVLTPEECEAIEFFADPSKSLSDSESDDTKFGRLIALAGGFDSALSIRQFATLRPSLDELSDPIANEFEESLCDAIAKLVYLNITDENSEIDVVRMTHEIVSTNEAAAFFGSQGMTAESYICYIADEILLPGLIHRLESENKEPAEILLRSQLTNQVLDKHTIKKGYVKSAYCLVRLMRLEVSKTSDYLGVPSEDIKFAIETAQDEIEGELTKELPSLSGFDKIAGVPYSTMPLALAASLEYSTEADSDGYSSPLRRVNWRGCYWSDRYPTWDKLKIDSRVVVKGDFLEVRFVGQPVEFEFSCTRLLQPDDTPEPKESYDLPNPQREVAKVVGSDGLDVHAIKWIVVYVYDGTILPFGTVVFEVGEEDG